MICKKLVMKKFTNHENDIFKAHSWLTFATDEAVSSTTEDLQLTGISYKLESDL